MLLCFPLSPGHRLNTDSESPECHARSKCVHIHCAVFIAAVQGVAATRALQLQRWRITFFGMRLGRKADGAVVIPSDQPSALAKHRVPCAQQVGRIHCAVFSDAALFAEVASKAAFWQQNSYYGVDLTCLLQPACEDYFAQVWARVYGSESVGVREGGGAVLVQVRTLQSLLQPACKDSFAQVCLRCRVLKHVGVLGGGCAVLVQASPSQSATSEQGRAVMLARSLARKSVGGREGGSAVLVQVKPSQSPVSERGCAAMPRRGARVLRRRWWWTRWTRGAWSATATPSCSTLAAPAAPTWRTSPSRCACRPVRCAHARPAASLNPKPMHACLCRRRLSRGAATALRLELGLVRSGPGSALS